MGGGDLMKLRRLFWTTPGENAVPRVTSVLATIAAVIAVAINPVAAQSGVGGSATNGPCGFGEYPSCKVAEDACALLSPEVLAAVLGKGWTRQGSGPMRPLPGAQLINDCQYDGPAENEEVILRVHEGGRAQFDDTVFKSLGGLTAVSGMGDAAYELVSSHSSPKGVRLWVMKSGTYFDLRLDSDNPNFTAWGAALAHKIVDRIK
jgi:hypothetical protein